MRWQVSQVCALWDCEERRSRRVEGWSRSACARDRMICRRRSARCLEHLAPATAAEESRETPITICHVRWCVRRMEANGEARAACGITTGLRVSSSTYSSGSLLRVSLTMPQPIHLEPANSTTYSAECRLGSSSQRRMSRPPTTGTPRPTRSPGRSQGHHPQMNLRTRVRRKQAQMLGSSSAPTRQPLLPTGGTHTPMR